MFAGSKEEPLSKECLFCRIAAGKVPADVVHESEKIVAFRDVNPAAPTHILLIPREHITDVGHLSPEHGGLLAELLVAAAELARRQGVADLGYRLVANTGPNAGQSVFHLHFHLLGGRNLGWPPG